MDCSGLRKRNGSCNDGREKSFLRNREIMAKEKTIVRLRKESKNIDKNL